MSKIRRQRRAEGIEGIEGRGNKGANEGLDFVSAHMPRRARPGSPVLLPLATAARGRRCGSRS